MIFDTHCHYNLDPLSLDHWQKAQEYGVKAAIVVGTDFETSAKAIEVAEQEPNLFAAVGYHPHHFVESIELNQDFDDRVTDITYDLERLTWISSPDKVTAIGETGLDYFRLPDDPILAQVHRETQREGFRQHLELAKKWQKPVIIHVRDQQLPETPTPNNAYWDTLELVNSTLDSETPFILHCVSGPLNYIAQMLEKGAYLGIAGNVTYKTATQIRDIVKSAPAARLLLETDAPFLPPQKFRGQTCEPWMISETAEFLKTELAIDLDQISQNALKVFNLPLA